MSEVIRFNYLHRDSGNWKKFGYKLFSNLERLSLEEIDQRIRQHLIDTEFFYPDELGIKKFRFHRFSDDYSWYEFESVEVVEKRDLKSQKPSISDFIFKLEKMNDIDVFLMCDQPTTCPLCGARTEVLFETFRKFAIQLHVCLDDECRFLFVQEEERL
jgi:hypothetical protein